MVRRTIAERAASGEIRSIQGLTHAEQGELLLWARQQGLQYLEIIRRYGFTQRAGDLRTWDRVLRLNHPPRVPTFTPTDDRLLLNAVDLYGTGPLDQAKSFEGIWPKVKAYIRMHGGTTTAGYVGLKNRWGVLRGQPVPARAARAPPRRTRAQPASSAPAQPRIALARSFTLLSPGEQPAAAGSPTTRQTRARARNSSAGAGASPDMSWGEYDPLSEEEMREALGEASSEANDEEAAEGYKDEWGEYDSLSDDEIREALGGCSSEDEEEEDGLEDADEATEEAKDDGHDWGEYDPLSENEMMEVMGDSSSDCEKERDDRDNNYEPRPSRSRKG